MFNRRDTPFFWLYLGIIYLLPLIPTALLRHFKLAGYGGTLPWCYMNSYNTDPKLKNMDLRLLTHILTGLLTYSLLLTLTHSLTHSYSLTHSPTHSLTHSLTHLLTHSPTHSLTHSPTTPFQVTIWSNLGSYNYRFYFHGVCNSQDYNHYISQ